MSFKEDLKSLLFDDYKLGVEHSSKTKFVFIDPNKFDLEYYNKHGSANPEDVKKFREMLDEQIPGFSSKFTDEQLLAEIPDHLTMGPFALPAQYNAFNGENICIVNRPHDKDYKNKEDFKSAALDHDKLIKHVPGYYSTWERGVGVHEGEHCAQVSTGRPLSKLIGEVESDQKRHDWFEDHGYDKISRAHADYRALGASWSDPVLGTDLAHSTSIFLNLKGDNPDGLKELHAADTYKVDMLEIMGKRIEGKYSQDYLSSLSQDETVALMKKELRQALDEGAFKSDNPYKEKFTRELIEGIEKGVAKPVDAEQNIIDAEAGFNDFMLSKVQGKLGAGEVAKDIQFKDPARFSKLLEECRKEGAFKHENPYMERYTNAYVDAYRRQIIEAKPDPAPRHPKLGAAEQSEGSTIVADNKSPEPQAEAVQASVSAKPDINVASIEDGSTPKVNLNDDVRATMSIGGVKASTYFASFADPALASDRIALSQQGQDTDLSVSPAVLKQNSGNSYRAPSMA